MEEVSLSEAWKQVVTRHQDEDRLGQTELAMIRISKPLGELDDNVLIEVPSEYAKTFLEGSINETLTAQLSEILNRPISLVFKVNENAVETTSAEPDDEPEEAPTAPVIKIGTAAGEGPYITHLNSKYTFETFVTGESNRFAHAAATAVAENPARAYNPLFIYGGSGLGKTHLLHAIGHYAISLYPHLRVRYINSEEFTNDFINSISKGNAEAFQRRYRDVDILMIDDIQFLQGKEQTVEEFFHTFNTLHNAEKQIIITSDVPSKNLSGFEERMRSRFEWGLITDVQPPDLETRIAILKNKCRSEDFELGDDVLEYIASRFATNIRELEGAMLRITAFSSLNNQRMTSDLAKSILADIISDPKDSEITPSLIKAQTADYFGLTVGQIDSMDRSRNLVVPRQVAMYLCRELTELSLPKIGISFGGRDHSTVIYAVRKVTTQIKENPDIFNYVTELSNRIRQAARGR